MICGLMVAVPDLYLFESILCDVTFFLPFPCPMGDGAYAESLGVGPELMSIRLYSTVRYLVDDRAANY